MFPPDRNKFHITVRTDYFKNPLITFILSWRITNVHYLRGNKSRTTHQTFLKTATSSGETGQETGRWSSSRQQQRPHSSSGKRPPPSAKPDAKINTKTRGLHASKLTNTTHLSFGKGGIFLCIKLGITSQLQFARDERIQEKYGVLIKELAGPTNRPGFLFHLLGVGNRMPGLERHVIL